MKSLISYITESRNLHLEHLEDSIFAGSHEVADAIRFVSSLAEMLKGSSSTISLSVKWDGAPAIFAGKNPENGKFFVGTKSVFNKTPKINYTVDDIRNNHSGGLATKLEIALENMAKLNMDGVYQGDMLFTASDVTTKSMGGLDYYVFTPNTITYAVPTKSMIGRKINRAKMGIVFHTKYTGKTMETMRSSFLPNVSKFKKTSNVWFSDATFKDVSGVASFNNKEYDSAKIAIRDLTSEYKKNKRYLNELYKETSLIKEMKIFVNVNVRAGKSELDFFEFKSFLTKKYADKAEGMGSERGKASRRLELDQLLKVLSNREEDLKSVFILHGKLSKAKHLILDKISKVKGAMRTFIQTDDGFKVTAPEGYVAIDRTSDKAIKLVDRMEFSKNNFNVAKNWVKG